MIVIIRGRITYYIKDDSVVVATGTFQYTSYNTFALANKGQFATFKDTILNSQAPAFSSVVDVVELSSQCEVYGFSTRKPSLEGIE